MNTFKSKPFIVYILCSVYLVYICGLCGKFHVTEPFLAQVKRFIHDISCLGHMLLRKFEIVHNKSIRCGDFNAVFGFI